MHILRGILLKSVYTSAESVHSPYDVGQTEQQKPNRMGITNNGWAHCNSNRRPEPVKRIIYNVANAIMLALLITLRLCLDLQPALVLRMLRNLLYPNVCL